MKKRKKLKRESPAWRIQQTNQRKRALRKKALRTNSIKFNLNKTSHTLLCRPCGIYTETIKDITNGCSKEKQEKI